MGGQSIILWENNVLYQNQNKNTELMFISNTYLFIHSIFLLYFIFVDIFTWFFKFQKRY